MFNFPLTKKLTTTQDRQILQNSDEKQDCQFWILRLVVFTRIPAIACWNSISWLNQLEQLLTSFTGENVFTLGLIRG